MRGSLLQSSSIGKKFRRILIAYINDWDHDSMSFRMQRSGNPESIQIIYIDSSPSVLRLSGSKDMRWNDEIKRKAMSKLISIIIVSYNTRDLLQECLGA